MLTRRPVYSLAVCSSRAVALCVALAPAAFAAEITYSGTWECEATPKLSIGTVRVPGTAVRDGDRLTVSRVVLAPGGASESGRASGTTTVRDGKFVVETVGPEGRIMGRYEGTASDAEIVLKGSERLKLPERGEGERACQATLKRR